MRKLDILVPQYKETDEVLKPLLDSIAIQQLVDFKDIGVIICNDGSDVHLTKEFLESYPFEIEYHLEKHRGVSGTRQAAFDYSKADYVMFCDADDMFFNACGIQMLFEVIDNQGFDTLVSVFMEETKNPMTGKHMYIPREQDSTFVHGKVHRRYYLLEKHIRWNEKLTIHEDSFFNILCQRCTDKALYCPTPFYLWKWRDDSVCRRDFKYILKTYTNMLDSNTALVEEFINRKMLEQAQFYATSMIFDAYYTMNTTQWLDKENAEYREKTEKRFKKYYDTFKEALKSCPEQAKAQISQGIRGRVVSEGGMVTEELTFNQWIKHIEEDIRAE